MILPAPLQRGDKIAIISPASIIAPERAMGAMQKLADAGLQPVAMPHAFDRHGTMAGTDAHRLHDIVTALTSPEIKAILCSRGGYGAVRLLSALDSLPLAQYPKWVIGYSDITALHCLMARHGIASLHAPMARHIAEQPLSDPCTSELLSILFGHAPQPVTFSTHPLSSHGTATGTLVGGNLSVLSSLIPTPFNPIKPGCILFVEDIAEPIYKVERIFHTLALSGILSSLSALIIGRFTRYEPSRDFDTMEQMLSCFTRSVHIPVAFGFPAGHVTDNRPLLLNRPATLSVTPTITRLSFR